MDIQQLEQMGEELRSLGHRRRELVEQIVSEVDVGDCSSSKSLYQELSEISEKAVSILQQQKNLIDHEIRKLH